MRRNRYCLLLPLLGVFLLSFALAAGASSSRYYADSSSSHDYHNLHRSHFRPYAIEINNSDPSQEIAVRYPSSHTVRVVRDAMPRFGPTTIDNSNSYAKGVILEGVPAYAIGVFFLIVALVTAVLSACGLCRARPSESIGGRWFIWFLLFLLTAGIATFCIIGIIQNSRAHNEIQGDDSVTTNDLQVMDDSDSLMNQYIQALNDVKNQIITATPKLQQEINSTGHDVVNVNTINSQIQSIINSLENINIQQPIYGNSTEYTGVACSFCKESIDKLHSIQTDITNNANELNQHIQSYINDINSDITSTSNDIINGINDAIAQIQDALNEVDSHRSDVNDGNSKINTYESIRFPITIAFGFGIPLLAVIFLALSLLTKRSWPFHLNTTVLFITLVSAWVLLGFHMSLLTVNADGCDYVDNKQTSLESITSTRNAAVMEACLLNSSLLVALNLTTALKFVSLMNEDPVAIFLNVSGISDLETSLSGLSVDNSFQFNNTGEQEALTALNALTAPDTYTSNNVDQLDVNKYPASKQQAISGLKLYLISMRNARLQAQNVLSNVQQNVSNILTGGALSSQYVQINNTVAPVIASGRAAVDIAFCGEVGLAYKALKDNVCWHGINHLSWIVLCLFIIAALAIPAVVCSLLLQNRYHNFPKDQFEYAGPWDYSNTLTPTRNPRQPLNYSV